MSRIEQSWEGIDLQLEGGDFSNNKSQAAIIYKIFEEEDDAQAIQAAYQEAPADYNGIPKRGCQILERLAPDAWKVEVSYSYASNSPSSKEKQEDTVSFDCGGGTRHITTAIKQQCLWKDSASTFRNPGNLIGWNGKTGSDSVITGVDVPFAQPRETYTKFMKIPLSTSKRRKIASLVGKVNANTWKGWSKGEVMFLGCSYSGVERDKAPVTFNFAIQMNETREIAEGVPAIKKEGNIYIWTQQAEAKDNTSPKLKVTAVFAAQVAEYADFSELGL